MKPINLLRRQLLFLDNLPSSIRFEECLLRDKGNSPLGGKKWSVQIFVGTE